MHFNNKTLAEINEHDKENLSHILQGGKVRSVYFPTLRQCSNFMGQCFHAAMVHLGIKITPGIHEKIVDQMLKAKGVRVERRKYPQDFVKCEVCGGDGKLNDTASPVKKSKHKKTKTCKECAGAGQVSKDEYWRSGLYIYKGNEIAAFISVPTTWKKTGIIIRPGLPTFNRGYKILTTVMP